MYRKKSRGWYKHKDFIFLDLVCLFLFLILAYLVRNGSVRNIFELGIYHNMIFFVILADLFLIIIFESYKGVLRRGYYQELRSVIQQMILIELASGLYLFTVSNGHSFSRTVLYLMGVFYVLLSYGTRIIWKKHLIYKMAEGGEHSLYIVTNYNLAPKVIQNVKNHNYNRYNINGLIIIDKNIAGREIEGIPVVADLKNAASYICQQWVDEVFINVDASYPYPHELINELLEMGMAVHVNLAKVRSTPGQKQFVETIGGYTVLTTTMNYATDRQALAKRALDILGGLAGCLLTGIIFIFVAPAIYISSPGPIFFSQIRIGQNGKPFKMYKFRSMYMDAEERRAELMAQNKMSDGRMFKIDFDPRVIGNKILPDGTRKTGIGEFIRKTSLDEFPQFWNVLNGTMSLVGTRPILQDELQKYELHHRARIAIKPGITGMWQVSGRSDIYGCDCFAFNQCFSIIKTLTLYPQFFVLYFVTSLMSDILNNYARGIEKVSDVSCVSCCTYCNILQRSWGGKNVINMLLLYFLGSYIRKYSLGERFDKKSLLKILIATTALNISLNSLISIATGGKPHIPFARDCSIFIAIEAVALMMFFMKVEFHSNFINRVAKHVFAVYLFEGAFRQIMQIVVFDYSIYEGEWYWPLVNIAVALIAMVGCMLIDVLFQTILNPFRKIALKMAGTIIKKLKINLSTTNV